MKRFNKKEAKKVLRDKYPKLSFQESVNKLKKEGYITVLNKGKSKGKSYVICESVL